MKRILIYSTRLIDAPPAMGDNVELSIWKPSLVSLRPPGKNFKYVGYSLFHFLGLFGNHHYCQVQLKRQHEVLATILVVPFHFKWPFMLKNDVQFTYVVTNPVHRGKGYAWQLIYKTWQLLKDTGVIGFWYVTDTENKASMRLAEKMGFSLFSQARHEKILGIRCFKKLVPEDSF